LGTAAGTSSPGKQLPGSTPQQPIGQGLSYQDVLDNVDEYEDEELIHKHKPQWQGRGGRKNKNKKNKKEEYDEVDWDAIRARRNKILNVLNGHTSCTAKRAWLRSIPRISSPRPETVRLLNLVGGLVLITT
jgi:hypothetical protein